MKKTYQKRKQCTYQKPHLKYCHLSVETKLPGGAPKSTNKNGESFVPRRCIALFQLGPRAPHCTLARAITAHVGAWNAVENIYSYCTHTLVLIIMVLLTKEILNQLIGSLSHCLQGFIHPRWCRISSINSIMIVMEIIVISRSFF